MALVKCRECSKEVSSSASKCPHCGVKSPSLSPAKGCLFIVIIAIVITVSVAFFSEDKPWYNSAELFNEHKTNSTASQWRLASENDRLASAGFIIAKMQHEDMLKPQISSQLKSLDDLKPFAKELKIALDESFSEINTSSADPALTETSVILAKLMGWIKE